MMVADGIILSHVRSYSPKIDQDIAKDGGQSTKEMISGIDDM